MNEHDIPIDIHTGKLQDWLISRRIVQKNWHTPLRDVRNKISNAVNDMPEHIELIKLLSGAHINYFHCLKIIDILKTTEADTKSLFGNYGSRRMKDWQEILKLYERENLYLAEASQILLRNITYELPSVKKQIAKCDQLIEESEKKIQDSIKTENILSGEHSSLCQQLGIKGVNLKEELTERIKELPQLYEKIATDLSKLGNGLEIYSEFCNDKDCLPLIRHMIKYGNTTVYQFIHNEIPLSIDTPRIELNFTINLNENLNNNNNNEIDFGTNDDNIDFGIETETIDFGNINLEPENIDWSVNVEEAIENISLEESGIIVESSGQDGGVAKGPEAYTILDSCTYRDQFIDEISELGAFLNMRLYELHSLDNSTGATSFSLIDGISTHDEKTIETILKYVTAVETNVTSELIQHLHYLKHSPKYGDLLAGKLVQKLIAIEKNKTMRQILKEKIITINNDKIALLPLVDKMIKQTKVLQAQIEDDISKRYKNRIVNLIGGINML